MKRYETTIYDNKGNQLVNTRRMDKDILDKLLKSNKDNLKLVKNWTTKYPTETVTAYQYKSTITGVTLFVWEIEEVA